jgi:hypothetical protein
MEASDQEPGTRLYGVRYILLDRFKPLQSMRICAYKCQLLFLLKIRSKE